MFAYWALWLVVVLAPESLGDSAEAQTLGIGSSQKPTAASGCVEPVWSRVTVLPGETWGGIEERFGVSRQVVCSVSGLAEDCHIETGTRLAVYSCRREPELFRVRIRPVAGESWYELAVRTGIDESLLKSWNPGRTAPGQRQVTAWSTARLWDRQDLQGGMALNARPSLYLKWPDRAWGRPVTVRLVERTGDMLARHYPGSRLTVGDLSSPEGGMLDRHMGHRSGLEVDLGIPPRKGGFSSTYRNFVTSGFDVDRTWFVLRTLLETGLVARIWLDTGIQEKVVRHALESGYPAETVRAWFQYPDPETERHGIVRHRRFHDDHIHVTFIEPSNEVFF